MERERGGKVGERDLVPLDSKASRKRGQSGVKDMHHLGFRGPKPFGDKALKRFGRMPESRK